MNYILKSAGCIGTCGQDKGSYSLPKKVPRSRAGLVNRLLMVDCVLCTRERVCTCWKCWFHTFHAQKSKIREQMIFWHYINYKSYCAVCTELYGSFLQHGEWLHRFVLWFLFTVKHMLIFSWIKIKLNLVDTNKGCWLFHILFSLLVWLVQLQ